MLKQINKVLVGTVVIILVSAMTILIGTPLMALFSYIVQYDLLSIVLVSSIFIGLAWFVGHAVDITD